MTTLRTSFSCLLLTSLAAAQSPDLLYTVTQPEQTMSFSGGTSLRLIKPNEIVSFSPATSCNMLAEKWAPRGMFHTQAGDEDGDDSYWEAGLFGRIDALSAAAFPSTATGAQNQRTVYYSPSVAMGTTVSGGPGLRPGDVGRIVRNSSGDGQVEYLITAEQIQTALGLPLSPIVVNVDAVAVQPNYGVLFSLEDDITAPLCTGTVLVRDGDVLMIPGGAMGWNADGTVAGVMPGGAVVAISEAQMDALVVNAQVTDRDGLCVTSIGDTDALELHFGLTTLTSVASCAGPVPVPDLIFAGETLTGGAILQTLGGGSIVPSPCAPLGTPCGMGPTMGVQIGLRPATAAQGIASSINGLCDARVCRFVIESPTPQIPAFTPFTLDVNSPAPLTFLFFNFAPGGAGAVAPSAAFPFGLLCYPDWYPMPSPLPGSPIGTAGNFATYTSPAVPFPVDLVVQAAAIVGSYIELSNPVTIEVF